MANPLKIRWEDEEEEEFPEELIEDILEEEDKPRQSQGAERPSWFLEPPEECMEVPPFGVSLVVGVTESGKTSLVKGLIRRNLERNSWHKVYVLHGIKGTRDYEYLPREAHKEVSEEAIKAIVEEQEGEPNQRTVVILDDVVGRLRMQGSDILDALASSSRHLRMHIILSVQDLKKVSPTIRDNSRILFITSLLREHCVKSSYDLTVGYDSLEAWKKFLSSACDDHRVIRVELYGKSKIKVFLPPYPPPRYRIKFSEGKKRRPMKRPPNVR